MKLILCSAQNGKKSAGPLQKALRKAGIDTGLLVFESDWQGLTPAEFRGLFAGATHLLIIADAQTPSSGWFSLVLGFALGRTESRTRVAFFRAEPGFELPAALAGLPLFDTAEQMAGYYAAEAPRWDGECGQTEAKRALLEQGLPLSVESLAHCVSEGRSVPVGLYLDSGFSADSRDANGVPLLCLAARGKQSQVARMLLERGADINLQSEDRGYSALMDAVFEGSADLVSLFVAEKSKLDLVSKDGQTALIIAVGRNDLECTRLLVQAGADPEIKDKLGLSAHGYAGLFHNTAILSLFASPKA